MNDGEQASNIIAIVDIKDLPGVRITSTVRCEAGTDIAIGDVLKVEFENRGDIAVPVLTLPDKRKPLEDVLP